MLGGIGLDAQSLMRGRGARVRTRGERLSESLERATERADASCSFTRSDSVTYSGFGRSGQDEMESVPNLQIDGRMMDHDTRNPLSSRRCRTMQIVFALMASAASAPSVRACAIRASSPHVPTNGGADSCATAEVISGIGVFNFDTSSATTGTQGQLSPFCFQRDAIGVAFDVWFDWTARSMETVQVSTCGLTLVDTKIAVWDTTVFSSTNGTCPPGNGGMVACIDDLSPAIRQSKLVFNAIQGRHYLIQIGSYPGSSSAPASPGGAGGFSIEYLPNPNLSACSLDDGESDAVVGVSSAPNAGTCMLGRCGTLGETARISGVEVAWGGLVNAPSSTLVDGTPVRVALWEDPNDDGRPADAVLIEEVATTIQHHDTDIMNVVPFAATHVVVGYYFVGAMYQNPALPPPDHRPFAIDWDNADVSPFDPDHLLAPSQARCFVGWRQGAPFNSADLSASGNTSAPTGFAGGVFSGSFESLAYNTLPLIRPICAPEAGRSTCSNDTLGTDHVTPCPCGNQGALGNGCSNSMNSAGARLTAYGVTSDDDVSQPGPTPIVLRSAGLPSSSYTMFLQHDAVGDTVFHDGVLCAGGSLVRLRGRPAGAQQFEPPGVALFPNSFFAQDSTTTLSSRGGVAVGSGLIRHYAAWYRNASMSFCPPDTANVSNGVTIVW